MKVYQFERQRIVNRTNSGVSSIKPLYESELNKFNDFFNIYNKLKELSSLFPQDKMVVEIQNVPEDQYEMIKEEIGIGENFTDHINKFFYNVNINAVIIVHKTY